MRNPTSSANLRQLLLRHSKSGLILLALAQGNPLLQAATAQQLPTGALQERGAAGTVNQTGRTLTVTTPGRAVFSWGTFNIGQGDTVDFRNGGAVLNYVRSGGIASQINGILRATNPLVLLNNQGISVGRTALISVPSLLLSTGSLLPDSLDKFMAGVSYGNGLNAPLISIQMSNGDGPILVEGRIESTNGGGIGLVAPSVTIAPSASLFSRGFRSASTGTDGVNLPYNGIEPEGTLWIGTTGLPINPFTAGAGLPTGFGFAQISGQPSPQSASLALQASYDLERFVIGTAGARAGQFDGLFFSPSFRASDFYVYDGIEAVEEGHRLATNGGPLKRLLRTFNAKGQASDQEMLESDVLGLQLPAGAALMNAEGVQVDQVSGKITAGTLTIQPSTAALANPDFTDQFGSGPLKVAIGTGGSSVVGSNGVKAAYDPQSGVIAWSRTIPGTSVTETVAIPGGITINQGQTNPGFTRPPDPGITQSFEVKEGYYYHGSNGSYAGSSPCPGCRYVNPVTGQVTYWRGHFTTDSQGHPQFTTSGGVPDTHVVYMVGGQYYVTSASGFNPQTTPKNPPTQVVSPTLYQQVTRPGIPTQQQFQQVLPLSGQATIPQGSATSTWTRPTAPLVPTLAPIRVPQAQPTAAPTAAPQLTPAPTLAPILVPQAQPTPAPTAAPQLTPAPTLAPIRVPQAQPTPAPTAAPQLTPAPTLAPIRVPQAQPTPAPTAAPQLTPAPTLAPIRVPPVQPTPAPTAAPQLTPAPTLAPIRVPQAQPTPAPTAAPS
ncbi:filamentous hemagglutinin N-terminal domain-containing protein [Cyanobium sp. ATX-6F1]|uniref:two-partner secretion domain-containing protein n=1 Tax=Cyanobium sp. ATX-6F1 TaxID=3137388 RepID=UPI0039BDEDC3